jgi:signal transduction histidine kinase
MVWLLCWSILCVLWVSMAAAYVSDAERAQQSMDGRISLTAKGFSEYVKLDLAAVDRLILQVRKDYQSGRGWPTQAAVDADQRDLGGLVLQMALADANGLLTASTLPMKPGANIADRKHFLVFKNDVTDRLFISEPVLGRVSRKPSLQLVRPLLGPKGEFQGVIVASIDPELLRSYFATFHALQDQGSVSVVGLDGTVRFRLTEDGFTAGQDVHQSLYWKDIVGSDRGLFETTAVIDGIHRRSAFQRVEGLPLAVIVGVGTESYLASFNQRWRFASIFAGVITAMLLTLAYAITRLANEQQTLIGELEESRNQAMEANSMKSHLLASVSHELRTPLNSILGFSELIRDLSADEMVAKYADLIHTSGEHLHSLVNTILDLAKIEAGRMGVTIETVDLGRLLKAATESHRVSADKKGLQLALTLQPEFKPDIRTDRTKLIQVLNNVLHNAIKFTVEGRIEVLAGTTADGTTMISVLDTGVGIAPSQLPKVFDRFNTVDGPTDATEQGSGLGLALCKELLGLMGGEITISSQPGQGTRVDIFISHQSPKEATA